MIDNNEEFIKVLTKVFNTPGICTIEELEDSKLFLEDLKEKLGIYLKANLTHPLGETLSVNIETVKWYIHRLVMNDD